MSEMAYSTLRSTVEFLYDHEREPTRREHEIITWVARGYTQKQIASIVHVTQRTVQAHLTNAYKKIGAQCATHAVALLLRDGILSADDISTNVRQSI